MTVLAFCTYLFKIIISPILLKNKKILKFVTITRIHKSEKRPSVMMDVNFGGQIIKARFSLADREKFEYQALVGRNILTGRAIVDTALSNTLR